MVTVTGSADWELRLGSFWLGSPMWLVAPQEGEEELSFEFRKQRFCWEAADGQFAKLRYPTHVCSLYAIPYNRRMCARSRPPPLRLEPLVCDGRGHRCGAV